MTNKPLYDSPFEEIGKSIAKQAKAERTQEILGIIEEMYDETYDKASSGGNYAEHYNFVTDYLKQLKTRLEAQDNEAK